MPVDAKTTKKTFILFTKALRQMEREVLAQTYVIESLKQSLDMASEIDRLLEAARVSPAVEQQLQEKYDKHLEKILAKIDEAALEKQLLSLLERVGSKGPIN